MKAKLAISTAFLAAIMLTGCRGASEVQVQPQTAPAEEATQAAVPTEAEDITEETTVAEPTEVPEEEKPDPGIPDGIYLAGFETDGTMFHVNETMDGKGMLTVLDGKMSIHLVMPSKNVINLFRGTAEDAQKEGAVLIEPVIEEVTYDDGLTEEVYAFDVSVPVLGEEFDCALVGTKGKWYDHKVVVSDPVPYEGNAGFSEEESYFIEVSIEGGSGRASITSPAKVTLSGGEYVISLEWSSPYYDYMIVDGIKYLPVNTEGNSVFEIPLKSIDGDISITADTTAMSTPHEIDYILHLNSATMK